jgi:ABC-type multidrug transport system fused ATPase/permease subunit
MPPGDGTNLRSLDPRLLAHGRAARTYVLWCIALGLGTAGLLGVQAALLADTITSAFLAGADLGALTRQMVLLAAVVIGRALLDGVQEVAGQRAGAAVTSELRARLLGQAMRLGPGWLSGERSGELTALAPRGLDALDGYFGRFLPQLALAVVVPAALLLALFGVDVMAAVTIAVTLPLVPVFMVLVGLASRRSADRQWRALAVLAGHFLDVVAGLPTLKAFGRAKPQTATIRAVTDAHARATMRTLRVAFLSALVLELLSTLSVALVAVGIGLRLVAGSVELHTALVVLILAPEVYRPLRQVGAHHHACAEGLAAARRVFEVLKTPAHPYAAPPLVPSIGAVASAPPPGSLPGPGRPNTGDRFSRCRTEAVGRPIRQHLCMCVAAVLWVARSNPTEGHEVERGSDKHGPRQDDELKSELAGLIGEAGGHREEWRDPEPPADDDPPIPGVVDP